MFLLTDRLPRPVAKLFRQPRHEIGCAIAIAAMWVARCGLDFARRGL